MLFLWLIVNLLVKMASLLNFICASAIYFEKWFEGSFRWFYRRINRYQQTGLWHYYPSVQYKNTNQIQKFRSVCLLHVSFKIVTKVLMNRLNLAAGEVISPIQTAFVIGRYIIEGVLTLYQALNSIHRKKQSALLLKVDFGKAYDKIVKCEF